MPLPKLDDSQIAWIIKEVAGYINRQRQTYTQRAVPLDQNEPAVMQPFFPASCLDSTKVVVLSGQRVTNPPFYLELIKMGFDAISLPDFKLMNAITYVDTVVSHAPFTEKLLFHELVHVVQYEKLGLPEFAAKYVRGFLSGGSYEAIPLERKEMRMNLTPGWRQRQPSPSRWRTRSKSGLTQAASNSRERSGRWRTCDVQ